jgi:hypothetical protein
VSFGELEFSNFMKLSPMGAELFHADRHKESNSRFLQFCERAYRTVVVIVEAAAAAVVVHSSGSSSSSRSTIRQPTLV